MKITNKTLFWFLWTCISLSCFWLYPYTKFDSSGPSLFDRIFILSTISLVIEILAFLSCLANDDIKFEIDLSKVKLFSKISDKKKRKRLIDDLYIQLADVELSDNEVDRILERIDKLKK